MFESAEQALAYIRDERIEMVDLKIVAIGGHWLHITIPARSFTAAHFTDGVGYDGSSGSGFARVESGDVVARPEPGTAFVDPFCVRPTLSFFCETVQADTKEPFDFDPRVMARKAEQALRDSGIADTAWMAPEFEFHIFDRVELHDDPYETIVNIVSDEVRNDGSTVAIPAKGGYLRSLPGDQLHDLRSDIAAILDGMGIAVRYHHHEVGAPGQCEIEVDLQPLLQAADQSMLIMYVIRNVAHQHGKLATFMPKPIYGEAGNGMHVHQRLTKSDQPLFYDAAAERYGNLSELALSYVAGLLEHGRALTGITNPSTNSYRRLVPGYEAPVNLFFSLGNRSAAIRVPRYAVDPDEKRIEYRPPDGTCNIYLALAGMLLAGLDGIQRKLSPDPKTMGPFDVDIAEQPASVQDPIVALPRSLDDALTALDADHGFLTRDGVVPGDFIGQWCRAKRAADVEAIARRPHPHEYQLYLDA